jgi:hypothetical protein
MATRMQQRRGTAAQWTSADPILAAGEIGFESDTGQFKIGDGVNHWEDLSYFKNLEDLGGSLDDYVPVDTKGQANGVAQLDATGNVPLSQLGNLIAGAPAALDTLNELAAAINDDATFATGVLSALGQKASLDQFSAHSTSTSNVHGISNTADLATKAYADGSVTSHNSLTTNVHGIANTALLATSSDVSTAVSTHTSVTTNIHGISDTSILATTTGAQTLSNKTLTTPTINGGEITATGGTVRIHGIYLPDAHTVTFEGATTNEFETVLTVIDPTADRTISLPNETGTVQLRVADVSDTEIGYLNGVTSAIQTQIDAKAPLSAPTFTGTVTSTNDLVVDGNLTVNGTTFNASSTSITIEDNMLQLAHQNAANTVDLGLVVAYNDGAAKHAGLVRDVSDAKWKLFDGVTSEPSTTVNFGQGSLDALAVGALEATTITPSSGVVFSDGTQTKEGVVSRTPIIAKTDSYTLSALTERDSLIEVAKSSATTITIPLNSAVAYPVGTSLDILQTGTGQVTIAGAAGVTVNATPGLKLRTQWSSATLFKRAENTWVVYGDLMA